MMLWEVTEDLRWLRLVEHDDELDLRQVEISFTREVKDWHFKKRGKYNGWDGKICFIQKKRFLPIALWNELLKVSAKFNLKVEIAGLEKIIDYDIKIEDFQAWVDEFFKDGIGGDITKMPRPYQVEAAFKIMKFRMSSQELATNSGKTLIVFMAVAYMMHTNRCQRFLMITPNVNLVLQAVDDWMQYGSYKLGMKFQQISGGEKEPRSEANIIVGNYQTLVKMDPDFFDRFDTAFVDEAHQCPAASIKTIISHCTSTKYRFGLSGTLGSSGEESADYLTIQMCLGPIVGKISPDFLFKNDYATPVHVRIIRLNYLSREDRELLDRLTSMKKNQDAASEAFNAERRLVVSNRTRLNFVVDMIAKTSKNSLVLFHSVETEYGRTIYNLLREKSADKELFYVDGEVDTDSREEFKKRLKTGENRILVASFKTFSTGISIDNIHNIFFVESYKSENIIKQSIGRGMRKHATKEKVNIIDFVDDFSLSKSKLNYLMKHSAERIEIYEREKFPYEIYDVDLTGPVVKIYKK